MYKAKYCFVNIYYISISCLGSNSVVSMEVSEPVGKKISDHINIILWNSFTQDLRCTCKCYDYCNAYI